MATYTGLDGVAANAFEIVAGAFTPTGGVSAANLQLNSTNRLDIQIGAVDALSIDDAAITNAAAADAVGQDCFVRTQDGGTDAAVNGGQVGGLLDQRAGDGSAGGADFTGGVGGAVVYRAGVGGAAGVHAANNPVGAIGGAARLMGGAGGAGGSGGTGAGGAGGAASVIAGAAANAVGGGAAAGGIGGDSSVIAGAGGNGVGAGNGGRGGDVLLTPGAAGTNGTPARVGLVNVADGFNLFLGVVTLPATTLGTNALMLDQGTPPVGAIVTAGIIYSDATVLRKIIAAGTDTAIEA